MRGIKGLHELSVTRKLEKGEEIRPTSSYKTNTEDDQEVYLDKLINDSTRAAPFTKSLIKDWDAQIKDVQTWRRKEEELF